MKNQRLIKALNLAVEEEIVMIVRRFPLMYWWKILSVVILLLLPFFLLYPLFQWQDWGPIIFSLLLAVGLFLAAKFYTNWYFSCLAVTSKRLIDFDQGGIFDRTVSEAFLDRVDDISYARKGLAQSLFKYGTLQYSVPPGQTRIIVRGVKNPQAVCQAVGFLVGQARAEFNKNKETGYPDPVFELKSTLNKLREQLGDDGFNKLVGEASGENKTTKKKDDKGEELDNFWQG